MSFAKAKIIRFNENPGCAPGVGSYDPNQDPKVSGAVFEKSERFKTTSSQNDSSSAVLALVSQGSCSSVTSTSLTRSTRNNIMEHCASESNNIYPENDNIPVFDEPPAIENVDCYLKQISKLNELINVFQLDKFGELQTALRKAGEEEFKKEILRREEENCQLLAAQLRDKPVIIDKSPTKNLLLPLQQQISPENREFIEAKHSALLRLSQAEDEIYKLKGDLREYERSNEKLDFFEKENLEKDKQIERLKTQIIKGNVELRENQLFFNTLKETFEFQTKTLEDQLDKLKQLVSNLTDKTNSLKENLKIKDDEIERLKFKVIKSEMAVRENEFSFDALRETFDNQAKTKEEDIAKLNKIISNLNNEIFVLKENLDLKVEREESLTKMLIAVKESLNVLKVECEDVTQKANNDIELLTTEMENIRECVKEKVELEDELKQQISCMRKECEDAISEKKLRENLAEEKISILQNELDESLKERKQNAECFNEKIADLKLKVADLETVNMDLKSRGEIAREIESQKQQLEEQLSNAKDVIQKLEQIRERLFCEKEVLENRNKICETDNITLKQDMDIMDEKLRQTNEDLINLKLNLDGKGKVIEKLNNNIQISSQKYEDLYKEFQTVVTNACDLKLEIEHFKESELGLSTEINKLRQINNEQERFMMENQVLKGQLKTQMEIASKRISDSEEKESEIWRRLIEKNNEVKAKISEIEVLKKDLESIKENSEDKKWKNLYEDLLEKVEPFKNQLDAYAHEKSLLTSETDHALKQLHDLQEKYAKFMGQANHKQKIQYLCKLQHELSKLRMENMKLKEMNYKQNLIIQKCQTEPTASNSTKTKAKKPSLPLKENTPSAFF